MSLLDSYRRNVTRKREEIAKLQQAKAKEQTKIANLSGTYNCHIFGNYNYQYFLDIISANISGNDDC